MKLDYDTLQEKLSELYYGYLDLHEKLWREADDRVWNDRMFRFTSKSAKTEAEAWLSKEREKVIREGGWELEELRRAEKAEWGEYWAELDRKMAEAPPLPSVEIIYDDGPEPEPESLEELVDPNEVETCGHCQCLKLVGSPCMNCEELQSLQGV